MFVFRKVTILIRLVYLSNRALFLVCIASSKHEEGCMGEFETVMQTRDVVEGLHNFGEYNLFLQSATFPYNSHNAKSNFELGKPVDN